MLELSDQIISSEFLDGPICINEMGHRIYKGKKICSGGSITSMYLKEELEVQRDTSAKICQFPFDVGICIEGDDLRPSISEMKDQQNNALYENQLHIICGKKCRFLM